MFEKTESFIFFCFLFFFFFFVFFFFSDLVLFFSFLLSDLISFMSSSLTPVRRLLLNELKKHGMSASPLAVQKTQRVLERLDANGKRDVHVYNVLLEIALFRKQVGPVPAFLAELEENKVVPDAHTLSLLLQTAPVDQTDKLVKMFRKKYHVKPSDEALLVLIERSAQEGDAERALRIFESSKTLQEKESAWSSLIVAHARAGAGKVKECGALLENMVECGLIPDISLFSETKKLGHKRLKACF